MHVLRIAGSLKKDEVRFFERVDECRERLRLPLLARLDRAAELRLGMNQEASHKEVHPDRRPAAPVSERDSRRMPKALLARDSFRPRWLSNSVGLLRTARRPRSRTSRRGSCHKSRWIPSATRRCAIVRKAIVTFSIASARIAKTMVGQESFHGTPKRKTRGVTSSLRCHDSAGKDAVGGRGGTEAKTAWREEFGHGRPRRYRLLSRRLQTHSGALREFPPQSNDEPLTPALSPPAATARQRGESEGERGESSAGFW